MASFTIPKWFKFLHFHLNDNKDTFSVQVGVPCREGDGDEWQLVDTENECKEKEEPEEPTSPNDRACMPGDCKPMSGAYSEGDPHNRTFDGIRYDTMSLGEFVYAEEITSTNDVTPSFGLQVRQQRLPETPYPWAAFNTAVAMRAGDHIFEIHPFTTTRTYTGTTLFVDGELRLLENGYHEIGDAILRIEGGRRVLIWTTLTGTPQDAALSDENAVLLYVDKTFSWLNMRLYRAVGSKPPWRGMFGTPDDNSTNDWADRTGNTDVITDEVSFANAWRITKREDSLFTYELGEGPETYNIPQLNGPPTRAWLEEQGFILQATNLLKDDCKADMDKIDPNVIDDIAMDIAGGDTIDGFLARGICTDSRVVPPPLKVGFRFFGKVVQSSDSDVGLQGQDVTVYSGGQKLCSTTSGGQGMYSCVFQGNADEYTPTLALRYTVFGTTAFTTTVSSPESGTGVDIEQNIVGVASILYAKSTFDTDDEEWEVFGEVKNFRYVATGGNPDGHICADDSQLDDVWYFQAPVKFLGDASALYNNTLTFELKQSRTDNPDDSYDDVILLGKNRAGEDIELSFKFATLPGTDWTQYSISLNEFGWTNKSTNQPATQEEMKSVLASLTGLKIRGDYQKVLENNSSCLDNVRLNFISGSFTFDDFSDLSPLWINGDAKDINATPVFFNDQYVLRLTETPWQSGSAFVNQPVCLLDNGSDTSFSTAFQFQLSDITSVGADGLAFVIATTPDVVANAGDPPGYQNINPSVAVEFDTFQNPQDISHNSVGINLNGNAVSEVSADVAGNFDAGEIWYAWIDYQGDTNLLEVRVSREPTRPDIATVSHIVDIAEILGQPIGFVGFTSSTGYASNAHNIRSWTFEPSSRCEVSGQSDSLNYPLGVAISTDGSLYIADTDNHRVLHIETDGRVTTFAGTGTAGYSGDGGPAHQSLLNRPTRITFGADNSLVDHGNHRIRRVGTDGIITTVAGNGTAGYSGDGGSATQAQLNNPTHVAVHADGSLYIAGWWYNHRIRRVGTDGIITTVAGNGTAGYSGDSGPATEAQLNVPTDVTLGADGSLYIADQANHCIRRVGTDGIITTFAGTGNAGYSGDDGPATQAQLYNPLGLAFDTDGNLYISEWRNNRVRRVSPDGIITTFAGTGNAGYSGDGGPATQAQLNGPNGLLVSTDGSLYIADSENNRIRSVAPNGTIITIAGPGIYW